MVVNEMLLREITFFEKNSQITEKMGLFHIIDFLVIKGTV